MLAWWSRSSSPRAIDFEPGEVFEQSPSPGQAVEVGEEITIFVVETAEKIAVPNVEGSDSRAGKR